MTKNKPKGMKLNHCQLVHAY